MQIIYVEAVAAFAGVVATAGLVRMWKRLTKIDNKAPLVVTRQDTHKTVTLPREYSPEAVRALTELVA